MKNVLILSVLFMSMSFYGQSVMASGQAYIGSGNDLANAKKSENYVIVTIKPQSKTVGFSVNGNVQNYRIVSSNLTNGGKTLKYMLSGEMAMTTSLMSKIDIIVFPWDPSNATVGFIKVKLTDDDKRLLGLNRN